MLGSGNACALAFAIDHQRVQEYEAEHIGGGGGGGSGGGNTAAGIQAALEGACH